MIRRRGFITVLSGAAAWPLAARGQRARAPVIGFLNAASPDGYAQRLGGFRQGLKDLGYVEGENVAIEYRWAEGQVDRLQELATDLVSRQVNVIVATGGTAGVILPAKAATTSIPIVFIISVDPASLGLVPSLARPGGNLTGINFFNTELNAKRLELLRAMVPRAAHVAVLVNPSNASNTEITLRDLDPAARSLGLQIRVLKASTSHEIDQVFATFERNQPDALFTNGDSLFNSRRLQLVHLASYYRIPATYASRDYPDVGGLMSYGTNVTDAYRQAGIYTGRILKGEKPANLPVMQPTKFEFVINMQTARLLRITVPPALQALATEIIE
jgi:putative ABC transport system substrate-binding protein